MNTTFEEPTDISEERMQQFIMALEFIPHDQQQWLAGKCTKSPIEIYLQLGGTFLLAAKLLRGESTIWSGAMDEVLSFAKNTPDLEYAKELMENFQQEFFVALDNSDDASLAGTIDLPWGGTVPVRDFLFNVSQSSIFCSELLSYYQGLLKSKPEQHF